MPDFSEGRTNFFPDYEYRMQPCQFYEGALFPADLLDGWEVVAIAHFEKIMPAKYHAVLLLRRPRFDS